MKNYFLGYACLLLLILPILSRGQILFDLSFPNPQTHYVNVKMQIPTLGKRSIEVAMPVWTPGSYKIREFSRNIENLKVVDQFGQPISFKKKEKNSWIIYPKQATEVFVEYQVYAFERSVRTSWIDESHAFLSPTSIFMFVEGRLNELASVKIQVPDFWKEISTGLQWDEASNLYQAANFDILYDSPIEIGNQEVFNFSLDQTQFHIAIYGGGNYDKDKMIKDFKSIIKVSHEIFDDQPNKDYTFIIHNYERYRGGLEHLNSTVIGASRNAYQNTDQYRNFLSLIAHEYFHLWNVKRLRPKPLGPFDYHKENYTTGLWFAEGFTSYYDNLIPYRAGLMNEETYLKILAKDISNFRNSPAMNVQSLKDSSLDAWIKFYLPNENSVNTLISYYLKGSLVAFCMDLKIIYETKGKKNLDDVMKAAYKFFYKEKKAGFTDKELMDLIAKVTGVDQGAFYNTSVAMPGDLKFEKYLNYVGLKLVDKNANSKLPYLGVDIANNHYPIRVSRVRRDSPAWKAGINVNDKLIAINNQVLRNTQILNGFNIGDEIDVLLERDGKIKNYKVKLIKNPKKKYTIEAYFRPTSKNKVYKKLWLQKSF